MSDFTDIEEGSTAWTDLETEITSDFIETGDLGVVVLSGSGYGEGGYGEGGYGGTQTLIINEITTIWTDIETP